jgi:4-hydroxy-tetrahydrodipicolinate reductase
MALKVGVFGAGGRMGTTVCRAVAEAPDLELVAAVDPHHHGLDLRQVTGCNENLEIAAVPDVFLHTGVDVVVDFTEVGPARQNLVWLAEHGMHAVVGTTGFTDADLERFAGAFTSSNCLIAPNFAIGAVLMMHFAEMAAPWFDTAEIIEMHHELKTDAPSGTAMLTAQRLADGSGDWLDDPTTNEVVPGARGGDGPGGIRIHSMRMRGAVAHQEVVLGATGQGLTIRHDSYDRSSFMPGVLLAVREVPNLPGLTVGLDSLLNLPGPRS